VTITLRQFFTPEHYRKGDTKECLNECLKAFESTMKVICAKRKWPFKPTDAAKELIDVCLKHDLIPPLIQSHIGGVRAALESGIPTIRNRLSGHGQGAGGSCSATLCELHAASDSNDDSILGGVGEGTQVRTQEAENVL
jgi:hypothetical protein